MHKILCKQLKDLNIFCHWFLQCQLAGLISDWNHERICISCNMWRSKTKSNCKEFISGYIQRTEKRTDLMLLKRTDLMFCEDRGNSVVSFASAERIVGRFELL